MALAVKNNIFIIIFLFQFVYLNPLISLISRLLALFRMGKIFFSCRKLCVKEIHLKILLSDLSPQYLSIVTQ